MPALHAEYMPVPTCPRWCDVELTFTTAPPTPPARMARTSCFRHMAVPRSAMSIIRRASSTSSSSSGWCCTEPTALLHAKSSAPSCSTVTATHRSTSASTEMSPAIATPVPPAASSRLDGFVGGRGIDVDDGDARPGGRKGERDRASEPAPGAGDQPGAANHQAPGSANDRSPRARRRRASRADRWESCGACRAPLWRTGRGSPRPVRSSSRRTAPGR